MKEAQCNESHCIHYQRLCLLRKYLPGIVGRLIVQKLNDMSDIDEELRKAIDNLIDPPRQPPLFS